MAFNLLPLELLPLIIQDLPLSSLYSLSRTCRSLHNNIFLTAALTAAIDAYFASNHPQILCMAAGRNCVATMRRCLDLRRSPPRGLLHLLAPGGSGEAVQLVLDYGASLHAVDYLGYRPVERAVACGNVEAVRVLLGAAAALGGPKDDMRGLAGIAKRAGHGEMEELLVNFRWTS